MNRIAAICDLVNETPFVDTHEHIIEESMRLDKPGGHWVYPCNDWAYLLFGYTVDDLVSSGMSESQKAHFLSPAVDPSDKWQCIAPYWDHIRHAGYARATRITVRRLYDEDICESSVGRLNQKYHSRIKPGYYSDILRGEANLKSCQVNSLVHDYCETQYPDLLMQDLSLMSMSTPPNIAALCEHSGIQASTLSQWHDVIDWYFERYGARAVAVKSQAAYLRRLDYLCVSASDAAPLFERYARNDELSQAEQKALEDHLFRYCIARATEYRLPVKLHTGYYAGVGHMPLDRVGQNPADMARLAMDFPQTEFVVMHIGYPYQDEMIALAKGHRNITIDMCWAWIINPAASVRFVKEYIAAAPIHKLLTFGGDYVLAEQVVGHADIARQGLSQALSELVNETWLSLDDAIDLIPRLMHGNAERYFPLLQTDHKAANVA